MGQIREGTTHPLTTLYMDSQWAVRVDVGRLATPMADDDRWDSKGLVGAAGGALLCEG